MAQTVFRTTSFALSTGTGTQDVTISGLGFTPSAAIVFMSGATTDDTLTADNKLCIGFTDGTNEFCVFQHNNDADTTSDARKAHHTDSMIVNYDFTDALECQFGFNSFISNGIRFDIDNQASTAYLCTLVLIGGTDVSGVHVGNTAMNAVPVDITAPNFRPDIVFLTSITDAGAVNNDYNHSQITFGIGIDDGAATQKAINWSMRSGAGGDSDILINDAVAAQGTFDGGTGGSVTIGTYDSQGFTLTPSDDRGGHLYFYMAIDLSGSFNIDLFDMAWPTSTPYTETAPGFTPTFGLITSARVPTTRNTNTRHTGVSIAAFDETSIYTINVLDENSVSPTQAQSMHSDQLRIINEVDDTDEVIASSYALNASGWEFTLSTTPGAQVLGFGLAIDGTADSTAPSLSLGTLAEADGPSEVNVGFTSDEAGTYYIEFSANATETGANVKAGAHATGSATASANTVSNISNGWTPGTSLYAHVAVEDAATNIQTTALSIGPLTTTAYTGTATFDGTTDSGSVLIHDTGTHTGIDNQSLLTDSAQTWTVDEWIDNGSFEAVNETDGSTAPITDNSATTVTGTLSGGTEDDWDTNDSYRIELAADSPDVIYHEAQVTVTSEAYSLAYYVFDNTGSTYSQTHTVNYTGTGLADGTYNVSLDTSGVPTLTPSVAGSPDGGGSGARRRKQQNRRRKMQ